MIFAGRKKYLDILMIYLDNLFKNNKIHEIHFWQFTNNLNDMQYLESAIFIKHPHNILNIEIYTLK